MKIKGFVIYLLVLLCGMFQYSNAQQTTLATGGDIRGNGGSVAFSTGQLVFTTHNTEGGSVIEGVQQTYLIADITQNLTDDIEKVDCVVYPNPVTDFLNLKLNSNTLSKISALEYLLFDMKGNMLFKKKLSASEEVIDMGKLVAATYFLKVTSTSSHSGSAMESTFKIIKQ